MPAPNLGAALYGKIDDPEVAGAVLALGPTSVLLPKRLVGLVSGLDVLDY